VIGLLDTSENPRLRPFDALCGLYENPKPASSSCVGQLFHFSNNIFFFFSKFRFFFLPNILQEQAVFMKQLRQNRQLYKAYFAWFLDFENCRYIRIASHILQNHNYTSCFDFREPWLYASLRTTLITFGYVLPFPNNHATFLLNQGWVGINF
jgi:hypothetical protein